MNCLPSTAIGTLLDNESFRIAISQRLDLTVCAPHKCRCGAIVDRYGLHPLSCRFSAGRFPRHSALNGIIKRALSSAGFNAVLEPVGLDRGDGKRPDGMTVFPFSRGKRDQLWQVRYQMKAHIPGKFLVIDNKKIIKNEIAHFSLDYIIDYK